jgi:hypothetical protein
MILKSLPVPDDLKNLLTPDDLSQQCVMKSILYVLD